MNTLTLEDKRYLLHLWNTFSEDIKDGFLDFFDFVAEVLEEKKP
jgi:hypothetical protein